MLSRGLERMVSSFAGRALTHDVRATVFDVSPAAPGRRSARGTLPRCAGSRSGRTAGRSMRRRACRHDTGHHAREEGAQHVHLAGDRSPTTPARYADRAAPTARARSRPSSVRRIARLRRSGPGSRADAARLPRAGRRAGTAPDGVTPSTRCTRSTVAPSRNWDSADSAAASVTEAATLVGRAAVTARPSSSVTTSDSAPSTLARARRARRRLRPRARPPEVAQPTS